MEAFLQNLGPRLLGAIPFKLITFQGKQDLLQNLPDRLRGYASYFLDTYRLVVLVDRDRDDCAALKARLEKDAAAAGLSTRSAAGSLQYVVANRVVIEELEAWYFGDWQAVVRAYPKVSPGVPQKAGFRDPDAIAGGTWEAFERILQKAGYHTTGLRKIEAAQTIAPHVDPARSTSRSFQVFRDTLLEYH